MHITHYEFQSLLRTVQRIERKVDTLMSKVSQLTDLAAALVSSVETLEGEIDELVMKANEAHQNDDDVAFGEALAKLSALGDKVTTKAADTRKAIDALGGGVVTSGGSLPPASSETGDPAQNPRSGSTDGQIDAPGTVPAPSPVSDAPS